jgi:hypothetical protein
MATTKLEIDDAITITLTEADLDPNDRKKIEARANKSRVLEGEEREVEEMLSEALPKAIARRVEAMRPKNFKVTELQFKLAVSGKLFGSGVSGEVIVKLGPAA